MWGSKMITKMWNKWYNSVLGDNPTQFQLRSGRELATVFGPVYLTRFWAVIQKDSGTEPDTADKQKLCQKWARITRLARVLNVIIVSI